MRFTTPWIMVALVVVPLEVQAGKGVPHVSAPKPPHTSAPKPPKVSKPKSTQLPALTPLSGLSPIANQNSAVVTVPPKSAIAQSSRCYSRRSYHRDYYGNQRRSYYPTRSYRRYPVTRPVSPRVQRLARLKADLDALAPRAPVTLADKETLKNDLLAVAEGSTKPGSTVVQTLSNHLVDALIKRRRPVVDTMNLANDLKSVMNSGNASGADALGAITRGEATLKAAGIDQSRLESIRTDLNAVASEARSRAPARRRLGGNASVD